MSQLDKPVFRCVAVILAGAAIAAAAMVVGWRLAGPTESDTELGRVALEVAPDLSGDIDAFVPVADWGLRTDSFDAPFELRFEVRTVDRKGALAAASAGGETVKGLEQELEDAARSATIRAFAWGLGATLVIALLLWLATRGSRFRTLRLLPFVCVGAAVLGTTGSLAWAAISFNTESFNDPSFYGRGEELAQLLSFFERQGSADRYASTFDSTLANFTAYLSDAPRTGEEGGKTYLFGSDLHNNAPILSALKGFSENEPVFLVGDFAQDGNETEARLVAPRIAALGTGVVAVSGNHDSHGLMEALVAEGVTVLEQNGRLGVDGSAHGSPLLKVGDLTVAGFADPLEWQGDDPSTPERVFSFQDLDDGGAAEEQAKEDLVSWFDGLPRTPDMVLVHQNVLAQHLAAVLSERGYAQPLTIVTGHNHKQGIDRYGPIVVVNAGTLGAGGLLGAGSDFAGLGELHLFAASAVVQSVDLIRIEPLSGQAEADRVVMDIVCPVDEFVVGEPCHYEPSGT
jgi:predicted phosphodiesterase